MAGAESDTPTNHLILVNFGEFILVLTVYSIYNIKLFPTSSFVHTSSSMQLTRLVLKYVVTMCSLLDGRHHSEVTFAAGAEL